jgi:hypothetical protein
VRRKSVKSSDGIFQWFQVNGALVGLHRIDHLGINVNDLGRAQIRPTARRGPRHKRIPVALPYVVVVNIIIPSGQLF